MPATRRQIADLEADYAVWRLALFEETFRNGAGEIVPDAPYHHHFWTWLWSIEPGVRPRPFVGIWPRGGAKSTNAEQAAVALGGRRRRRYGWYISGIQDQADDHVGNVAAYLESRTVATYYPDLASRRLGKYGSSKGWRVNRLRTRSGFTIDAIGLDKAVRGVKLEDARPDFMIIDDVDDREDSEATTLKKIRTLTETLIPAGSADVAIIAIQNLIHPHSIFHRIADGRADFLHSRIVSGPIPAIANLTFEHTPDHPENAWTITGGEPTWPHGHSLADAQAEINDIGITAYLGEKQHEVEPPLGGMFDHLEWAPMRIAWADVPELTKVVCWVDPAVTDTDMSDSQAIQIDGIDGGARDGTIYRLWSWEQRSTPRQAITTAIRKAAEFGAGYVGIETDQGGDTWTSVYREARQDVLRALGTEIVDATRAGDIAAIRQLTTLLDAVKRLRYDDAKAGAGRGSKAERAQRMLADYERPGLRIRHVVGTHTKLERALRRFPRTKPFDLTDAAYWSWNDLRHGAQIAGGDPEPTGAADHDDRAIRDAYTARRPRSIVDG